MDISVSKSYVLLLLPYLHAIKWDMILEIYDLYEIYTLYTFELQDTIPIFKYHTSCSQVTQVVKNLRAV